MEPLSAVPLNDELQQARASAAKAEADVLLQITHKVINPLLFYSSLSYLLTFYNIQMQEELDDIENLFNSIIQLDVVSIHL